MRRRLRPSSPCTPIFDSFFANVEAARAARHTRHHCDDPNLKSDVIWKTTIRQPQRTCTLGWAEGLIQAIQLDDGEQAALALAMPGANIDEPTCTSDFHQVQYGGRLFRLALFPFGWDGRLIRIEGDTALHLSVRNEKFEVARVLLAHRARTDIENCEGTTVEKLEWQFRQSAAKERAETELSQKNFSPKSKFRPEYVPQLRRESFQNSMPTYPPIIKKRSAWKTLVPLARHALGTPRSNTRKPQHTVHSIATHHLAQTVFLSAMDDLRVD